MAASRSEDYLSRVWRAMIEFEMLSDHDRILIGLSGGKDSMFLTYALSILKAHSPLNLEIAAFTLDPMFGAPLDTKRLNHFCESLGIKFYSEQVNIAQVIKEQGDKDACFTCAFFRRGAINRFAKAHGFNKIAYAHHHDDVVETFLMSILYSGQIKTFLPKTYLDRSELTVIRPLIYVRESQIKTAIAKLGFTPLKNPCPRDGYTKRQEIKELIEKLEQRDSKTYLHLASAMRQDAIKELWPIEPSREELKQKFKAFWAKPS